MRKRTIRAGHISNIEEIFLLCPGVTHMPYSERQKSRELFMKAFGGRSITAGERHRARAEFFEYTGLPEQFFPWEEWREYMGYE